MYKLFWFFFLLPVCSVHADFKFLIDEGYDITVDNGILETRAALYINHSNIMADADAKIAAALTKIDALNYDAAKLAIKTDQISVLINAYTILQSKIKSEYAKFKRIRNSLGSTPTIPVDRTFFIQINNETAMLLLNDLATAADNIHTAVTAAGSWETLSAQSNRLSVFASAAENIMNIMTEYYSMLTVHTNILKLSTEGTLHDDIKPHFFLDGTAHIDFKTLTFLAAGKQDNNAVFIIEYDVINTVKQISKQVPVAFYDFSLEDDYFYDDTLHNYDKSASRFGSTLKTFANRTRCLTALNTKNVTATIQNCQFVTNQKYFDVLGEGILIHKPTPAIINSLKRDLQFDAKDTIFPVYIRFEGNLTFTDKTLGHIRIEKHSPFLVQSHSLSPEMLSYFQSFINTTLFPKPEPENVFDYILHDFDEIIINMTIFLCVIMLIIILKSIYECYQTSTTDPNLFILRILRQRFRRN